MILEALAAATLSQQAPSAPPMFVSAADVVRICRSQEALDITRCLTYITGVHDAALAIYPDTDKPVPFCIPDDMTIGRLSQEVAESLAEERWLWQEQSAATVVFMIGQLYPCMTVAGPND